MNRFILQFNKLLFDRNRAEDRAEFDTKIVRVPFNYLTSSTFDLCLTISKNVLQVRNVRRRVWPIEEHAMTFYIAAVYDLFRKEVDKSTDYFAVEKTKNKQFDVVYVKPDRKLPWAREKFTVVISNGVKVMTGLYKHFGVLCSHVLRVSSELKFVFLCNTLLLVAIR